MMLEEFAKASKGPVEESLTISHEEMDTMRARLVAGRFEEWGAVPLEADDCVLYLEPAVSRAAQPPSIAVEMFLDGAGAETAAYRLLADLALWRQWDVLWASIRRVDSERPPHPASFLDVLHLLTAMPPNFLSARDLFVARAAEEDVLRGEYLIVFKQAVPDANAPQTSLDASAGTSAAGASAADGTSKAVRAEARGLSGILIRRAPAEQGAYLRVLLSAECATHTLDWLAPCPPIDRA